MHCPIVCIHAVTPKSQLVNFGATRCNFTLIHPNTQVRVLYASFGCTMNNNNMYLNNIRVSELLNMLQRQPEVRPPQAPALAGEASTTDLDASALELLFKLSLNRNTRMTMMDAPALASSTAGGRAGAGDHASAMTSSDWGNLIIGAQRQLRTIEQDLQGKIAILQAQAQHQKQQQLLACLYSTAASSGGGAPAAARSTPTAAPCPEPPHVCPPRMSSSDAALHGQRQILAQFLVQQQQRQPVQAHIQHHNVLQDQEPPQTAAFVVTGLGNLPDSSRSETPSTATLFQMLGLSPPGIISSSDQTMTTTISAHSQQQQSASDEVREQGQDDHDDVDTSPAQKGRAVKFPQTLHNILVSLEQDNRSDIAAFTPDGTGFVIYKPKEFIKDYFSKYFRASSFSSFQRQINLYCFQRIKCGTDNIYWHPKFRRNCPDACLEMKRTKIKNARLVTAPRDKNHC